MEFNLSVFTLILVLFTVQVVSVIDSAQIYEDCFKEVGIHDPVIIREVTADPVYEFPEKRCFLKCVGVASNMVTQDGVLIPSTIEKTLKIKDIEDLVKKCQIVAQKKESEGPCEVFHAGYNCLFKTG